MGYIYEGVNLCRKLSVIGSSIRTPNTNYEIIPQESVEQIIKIPNVWTFVSHFHKTYLSEKVLTYFILLES